FRWTIRLTEAGQINRKHLAIARQRRQHRTEDPVRHHEAVEQHHRPALFRGRTGAMDEYASCRRLYQHVAIFITATVRKAGDRPPLPTGPPKNSPPCARAPALRSLPSSTWPAPSPPAPWPAPATSRAARS